MSTGVEFDEEGSSFARPTVIPGGVNYAGQQQQQQDQQKVYLPNGSEPRMIQWLLAHGYIKNPQVGYIVLIVVIGLNVLITYFVVTNFL
ncbi:MAG: hypothetical protein WCK03_00765 [Candidatus Taylorbacteria bacterium]